MGQQPEEGRGVKILSKKLEPIRLPGGEEKAQEDRRKTKKKKRDKNSSPLSEKTEKKSKKIWKQWPKQRTSSKEKIRKR